MSHCSHVCGSVDRTQQEVIQQIGAQHETVVAVLRLRLANVQALRRLWARGDARALGAAAAQMGDASAVADFLEVRSLLPPLLSWHGFLCVQAHLLSGAWGSSAWGDESFSSYARFALGVLPGPAKQPGGPDAEDGSGAPPAMPVAPAQAAGEAARGGRRVRRVRPGAQPQHTKTTLNACALLCFVRIMGALLRVVPNGCFAGPGWVWIDHPRHARRFCWGHRRRPIAGRARRNLQGGRSVASGALASAEGGARVTHGFFVVPCVVDHGLTRVRSGCRVAQAGASRSDELGRRAAEAAAMIERLPRS